MKKILTLLVVITLAIYGAYQEQGTSTSGDLQQTFAQAESAVLQEGNVLQRAFANGQSDLQIRGQGVVVKTLRDDLKGSRHQKFILQDISGQTVLVAHNIDLAPRLDGLKKGDRVEYSGEYEWNTKGGVLHWTHKDPRGRHQSGWLKFKGLIYQ